MWFDMHSRSILYILREHKACVSGTLKCILFVFVGGARRAQAMNANTTWLFDE